MKHILILGHKGMLGNAVYKFFYSNETYKVSIIENRWSVENKNNFKAEILEINPDFIINCIGKIPQKKPEIDEYENINIELPIFLESLNIKTIHPSTDCEFRGKGDISFLYTKESERDTEDAYGKSKASISKKIEKEFRNTKIIRVSIIGHEIGTKLSLLEWFLSSEHEVNGYEKHYWNGVTTLEWANLAEYIIRNWDTSPVLNQYGTEEINSKYELLNIIKDVYQKDIKIEKSYMGGVINKCMKSDKHIRNIKDQLIDLRDFYKNNNKYKILILGANGKIGSRIHNHLTLNNFEVVTFSERIEKDNLLTFLEKNKDLTHIINLISKFEGGRSEIFNSNLGVVNNILSSLTTLNIFPKIIHFSSGGVYASTKETKTEDFKCDPATYYLECKSLADSLLCFHNNIFDITILRPGSVFGYGINSGFIYKMKQDSLSKNEITVIGSTFKTRSICNVEYLLDFVMNLIKENLSKNIINIATQTICLEDYINYLQKQNTDMKIINKQDSTDNENLSHMSLDSSLANSILPIDKKYILEF